MTSLEEIAHYDVVVMCGISGSGKTEFSRRLTAQGYERLSADALLWSEYGDVFPSLPQQVRRKAFAQLGERLVSELDVLLRDGSCVVVDATMCKRSARDEVRKCCLSHGRDPLFVYLKASYPTLLQRLAGRSGIGPDDQIVAPECLLRYCEGFQEPEPDENHITIVNE